MPIYEYECRKCGAHVEALQKISDKPLKKCQKCGGKLEKKWSQTGFQFKGSGWYVTDYARKGKEKSEGGAAESKAEAGADSKSETKSDSKSGESKSAGSKGEEKKTPKSSSSSKGASAD